MRLADACRRLRFTCDALLHAPRSAEDVMLHKAKDALFPNAPPIVKIVPFTSNQVREYLYENYLSSLYALSEILRCLEDVGYFPPDYYKSVTTAIANDELLKYLSKARIAQNS